MKKVQVQFPKLGAQYASKGGVKGKAAVKNPVTREHATEKGREMIKKLGVPPKDIVQIGKLAEAALHDKSKYSAYQNYFIDKGLDPAKVAKPDFQMMSTWVVLGKIAKEM